MEAETQSNTTITRHWMDEINSAQSSRVATSTTGVVSPHEEKESHMKQLFESREEVNASDADFQAADVAKEQLQRIIEEYDQNERLSVRQKLGFSHKPAKAKVAEVLRRSMDEDIIDLETSINNIEEEWKDANSSVFASFRKMLNTLESHKTILKLFPTQNNYTAPLVGSVTILMKAAKSHSDVALFLSKSIADISEKVATCSRYMKMIKTPEARRKLAKIYARMFKFYQNTLEWYLQSKVERFVRSFNENLVNTFEDAKKDLEDCINELHREVSFASTSMVASLLGKMDNFQAEIRRQREHYDQRDMLAGQRMELMMQAWSEASKIEQIVEIAIRRLQEEQDSQGQKITPMLSSSYLQQFCRLSLGAFIIDDERPASMNKACIWIAERDILTKLSPWTTNDTGSRTMWISSPYESGAAVSESQAVASAVVTAAWQAESPIINVFCKRPRYDQLRSNLGFEQVGLISLVYRLIHQLLQFCGSQSETTIKIDECDLSVLDGEACSWEPSLKILRTLLSQAPVITFCVIDGLNELEWSKGGKWCDQLLNTFKERQQQSDSSFNLLLCTTGQSIVLPKHVEMEDRHIANKRAKEFRFD